MNRKNFSVLTHAAALGLAYLFSITPRLIGRAKRMPGLYFAGEVLDLDAVTGGYNLQIAWSTAYLAALAVSEA